MSENDFEPTPRDVLELDETVNIPSLDLTPADGFLLSQVDGMMTVADLKIICNLPEPEFVDSIKKLVREGVLSVKGRSTPLAEKTSSVRKSNAKAATLEERVLDLYLELEHLDYYQLLEIRRGASSNEIKKAFYRMTKEYHPDKFFRGENVEIRERLQSIFAKINDAYQLLMDKRRRREYDKELTTPEEFIPPEEKKTPPPSKASSKPSSKPRPKPRPKRPPRPPSRPPSPPKKNPFMDNVLKAKRLYEGAMQEIKRNNYASARQNIRIAISLDPYNKKYNEAMSKLDKLESVEQAKTYYQAGVEHEKEGRHKEASRLYREAMLLDGDNALYYVHLAEVTFEQDKNLDAAKKLVQKAIELNPDDHLQYLLLGRIFQEQGQPNAAIAQFEKGLNLKPRHKELTKELKRAKKGK